jgi:hypothetical protein
MYELLKELKEKGFPQEGRKESYCPVCNTLRSRNCWTDKHDLELLKHPTLEEAIQACGDDFYYLYRLRTEWQAHSNSDWDMKISPGKKPLEAVLRLWIALQNNK